MKRLSSTEGYLFDIDYGRPFGTAIFIMIDTNSLISDIVSTTNLEAAYLKVVGNLFVNSISKRYAGFDGTTSGDTDAVTEQLLISCREDMLSEVSLIPVVSKTIPKSKGGTRQIFIYSLRDRIKAQAIYQMLEPVFERHYSSYLFSYRSKMPSYFAIKGVIRRYLRGYGQNYLFVTDLQNYGESIDHHLLVDKLYGIGLEADFIRFLSPYIHVDFIDSDGMIKKRKCGLITGVPLIGLFSNLYLNDLDLVIGKRVSLYRRVGDDLIVMDKDSSKVKSVVCEINEYTNKHNVVIHPDKTYIGWDSGKFSYLGFDFTNGNVSISTASIRRLVKRIQLVLPIRRTQLKQAMRNLRYHFYKRENSIVSLYRMFVKQHLLVSQKEQFKEIDNEINRYLTKCVFGRYTERNHRLLRSLLQQNKIPSLYGIYQAISYEYRRKDISS